MTTVPAREGIIYGLSCTCHPDDGIRYVGQTVNPKARLSQHRASAREGEYPLHRWMRKHGFKSVIMEELCRGIQGEELDALEVGYIASLNTFVPGGLNLTTGGQGTRNHIAKNGGDHHSSKLTDQEAGDIYNLVFLGEYTQHEIAKAYGVSKQTVTSIIQGKKYRNLKLAALPNHVNGNLHMRGVGNHNSKLSDTQVREIHARYGRGESSKALSVEFGISQAGVVGIVAGRFHSRLGLPKISRPKVPPAKNGASNNGAKLNESQVKEIHRRVGQGERIAKLRAEFGVGDTAIRSIVSGKTWKHLNLGGAKSGLTPAPFSRCANLVLDE